MRLEDLLDLPVLGGEDIFYNGYFVGKTKEDLDGWIGKQFSLSSDIKSLKRKRVVQMILEKFSKYFESLLDGKYSFHFLVGEEYSKFVELDKSQLEIIKRYHKREDFLMEEMYDWKDFYFNDKFWSVYEVDKNDVFQHYYFTLTKFEERDRIKFDNLRDYLLKFPVYFFVENEKSKVLEKMTPRFKLIVGRGKHEQLVGSVREFDLEGLISKLEMEFVEMSKNPDKYVYGNEIIGAIKNYEVKEIYCYESFRGKLERNLDRSLFNFRWNVYPERKGVEVLEKLGGYRGIFGVKYF